MKRNDYIILAALFALLLSWGYIDRTFIRRFFPAPPPARTAPTNAPPAAATTAAVQQAAASTAQVELVAAPDVKVAHATQPAPASAAPHAEKVEVAPQPEERLLTLTNNLMQVVFSSRGASVRDVTLFRYRQTQKLDSSPVVLNFTGRQALAYTDLKNLTADYDFTFTRDPSGKAATFERRTAEGLRLRRRVELDNESYVLRFNDEFVNESPAALELPPHSMQLGPMQNDPGQRSMAGFVSLGVDSEPNGGNKVQHWGRSIGKLFQSAMEDQKLSKLPVEINRPPADQPVFWVAAKNKYFVQILTPPEDAGVGCTVYARRQLDPRELADAEFRPKMTPLGEVSADVQLSSSQIARGETSQQAFTCYFGPKKYSDLIAEHSHKENVMEFGMWAPVGKVLLRTMNIIHDYLWPHNYGIAIMLLTIIIRVLFWPITHKSTESMKKMAAVQPQVEAIKAKFKDNPQRLQQETMQLYRENKINPLGGCIPMLVQIPVFIALFVVLRSAIELRFASFLWIRDLSEPENLMAGVLPMPLNVLPLLMAATMWLQQRMTPSAGDPAQAKMMRVMMPIMMLFLLYNYASGLALYWTTQNASMIVQQLITKRFRQAKA